MITVDSLMDLQGLKVEQDLPLFIPLHSSVKMETEEGKRKGKNLKKSSFQAPKSPIISNICFGEM